MGGILGGRMVQVVTYDDGSTTAGVSAGVTKLVLDENVSVIAPAGDTNPSLLVGSESCEKLKVLHVSPGTYELAPYKYTINSSSGTAGTDDPAIKYITTVLKPKTTVIITENDQIALATRLPRFTAAFTAAGIKNLDTIVVPFDTTDFSPYITRVKYLNPNVLLLNLNSLPALFAKQLPGLGGLPNTQIVGISIAVTSLSTVTYPVAIGWYSPANWVPGMTNPAADAMLAGWTKANGNTNTIYAPTVVNYVGLWTAIGAIQLAGSTDREKINQAAHSGNLVVDTPYGTQLKVKPDGTNDLTRSVVKFLANGVFQVVQTP